MNVKDAYVIAHASPFEDELPDYLVDDFVQKVCIAQHPSEL